MGRGEWWVGEGCVSGEKVRCGGEGRYVSVGRVEWWVEGGMCEWGKVSGG